MLTREEAYRLAESRFTNRNLFKHVLAVEAVMRELAAHFGQDVEQWGLAGLLHDLDYEETAQSPERHGLRTVELLAGYDVDEEVIHAIKSHNNHAPRETLMDKAMYASDPVTGLIVAAALMHPSKKLAAVDVPFILRRFKEKAFAKGANREQIKTCEEFGLQLDEFLGLALKAMQGIHAELGL
ncbi:MAG: HDIG domain-containing protein [candidate division KSB1 bacterium]|nr:HDIG domain-containing protein [candidate division KSB1 bacterium]MDZ7295810.1 HDIG domain-containing protein [candidate division KSB1 bacterium]MDZ7378403.1 HDIG domain-containing protein [candidate division KSB1 bacterium]MDZ7385145.1 HDIG domain-containing protein [candidate division KSB1 bacterium]MDZ7391573.1 HDIG domain-containing protein [candidate division KSB1 bacterium]